MSRSVGGLWEWENVLIAYSYRWYAIREEFDARFEYEVGMITHALMGGCEFCPPPRYTVEH